MGIQLSRVKFHLGLLDLIVLSEPNVDPSSTVHASGTCSHRTATGAVRCPTALALPQFPCTSEIPLKGSTMIEKTASVHWEGPGKKGQGQIRTETGALDRYPYGFASRFEDDRRDTNPEEILAAAHAACFTMAFSFACDIGRVCHQQ